MTNILVTQSSMPGLEEYTEEIKDLWDSKWLTNMGSKHRELQLLLEKYLGVTHAVLFCNGHLALEALIEANSFSGEVITTPFTFASTTHAIVRKGLTPVFCDINKSDYTIDADKIEALITEKTTAIMPVHVYGNICDIEKIQKIANKYQLKVLYDAAHAFGVKVNGKGVGNFGDASMFSFHATKIFNTIEGGAIVSDDTELIKKLNLIKNFGITGQESVEYIGMNAKMNEFQAAMGICNLRHIDKNIELRKSVYQRYLSLLKGKKGIKIIEQKKDISYNYSYMPILFDGFNKARDVIYEQLKSKGINTRKYFYPLTTEFECYKDKIHSFGTPIALHVSKNILALPIYSELNLDSVDKICKIILDSNYISC